MRKSFVDYLPDLFKKLLTKKVHLNFSTKDFQMTNLRPPQKCNSMAELRKEIDAIDILLLDLLAIRSRYIDSAIDLKRIEGLPARTVDRVAKVLNRVKERATEVGLDEKLAETLWSELIEWSIERESKHLG